MYYGKYSNSFVDQSLRLNQRERRNLLQRVKGKKKPVTKKRTTWTARKKRIAIKAKRKALDPRSRIRKIFENVSEALKIYQKH